jgi:hypothetical protein
VVGAFGSVRENVGGGVVAGRGTRAVLSYAAAKSGFAVPIFSSGC